MNIPRVSSYPLQTIDWNSQGRLRSWARDLHVADEERVVRLMIAESLGENSDGQIVSLQRHLDLSYQKTLTSLPPNLTVEGDLILKNCLMLKNLPDNLRVGGNLVINSCPAMKNLGKDGFVHAHLILERADFLEDLGTGLVVEGNFSIKHCRNLIDLSNISVKGSLNIQNTPRLKYVDEVSVGTQLIFFLGK